MSPTQELLALNLKRIRKEKQLSQKVVSDRSGVITSTYSRIESCLVNPNLATIEKIADALEVPIKDLFELPEITDQDIVRKLETLNKLSEYNRSVVEVMIDTVIEKDKLEKAKDNKLKNRLEELEKIRIKN